RHWRDARMWRVRLSMVPVGEFTMKRSPSSTHLSVSAIALSLLVVASAGPAGNSALGQSTNPFLSSAPGYPSWSAFTGVRWEGDQPSVRFEGQWYELVSFHGLPVEEILKHCDDNGWSRE